MTVSNESESVNRAGNAAHADLNERAAAAARAELRGERENMLGAIGTAGPAPLARARDVPERWTFLFVMERMEEGFRILSRLPLPTRALPPAEMAKLRGAADSIALRLRHHDDAIHAARSPATREARDVFDALEQVRVETIGAEHMNGVAANLRARLEESCEAEGFDRMTRKDQLPASAALCFPATSATAAPSKRYRARAALLFPAWPT